MARIAKFLSWCFAAAALIFAWTFLTNLRYVSYVLHLGPGAFHGREAALTGWLLLLPPVLVVVYGMAWWTTHKATAHARGWAIAASVVNILFALSPLLFLSRIPPRSVVYVLVAGPGLLILVAGIAGVVVFCRRDVMSQAVAQASQSPRRPGDGTSPFLDIVAQFAGIAAVLAGLIWLGRWGQSRGLPPNVGLWFWIELLLADLVVVFIHELGHVSVGRALGMRMRAFTVGPFQWQIREGKWRFQFQLENILTGGGVSLVPTRLKDSEWRDVCATAAGPAASLCLGLVALWATFSAKGRPWEPEWALLGLVALISLVAFAMNLLPFRPEAAYSDGAHIYQALTHGPWSDVRRVMLAVGSSLVTPLRPKDFDAEALRRGAGFITTGHQAFFLRMYLFMNLLDCGHIPEALAALADAETVYEQSASDLPGEMLGYFVYANAFLKPDAARARYWWDRMETKKPRQSCTEYRLARTSIFWIENEKEKALEAWEQGNALAQKLPRAGAYDFDRSIFIHLHQMMDAPCAARN